MRKKEEIHPNRKHAQPHLRVELLHFIILTLCMRNTHMMSDIITLCLPSLFTPMSSGVY